MARPFGATNLATREVRVMAREHGPKAIDFYARTLDNPDAPFEHRDVSARMLLAYAYGRPSRDVNVNLQVGNPWAGLSLAQIADRAEQLALRARQAANEEAARLLPADTLDAVVIDLEPEGDE